MFSDFSIGYGYLPVGWAIFTSLTFLMCYGIAVSQHHIYPFVPAISDTGARVPESNIFSEFFNFSMVLMALSLFVRYLQYEMLTKGLDSPDLLLRRLNKVGLGCGLVSVFGGTIIANFPSNEVCSNLLLPVRFLVITNLSFSLPSKFELVIIDIYCVLRVDLLFTVQKFWNTFNQKTTNFLVLHVHFSRLSPFAPSARFLIEISKYIIDSLFHYKPIK